jgi:maltose O-acetyltransferase
MLNRFHRAFRSPIKFYLRLRLLFAPVYLLRLKLQAWLYGGQVEIGRSVRINHPTQFQGSGKLVLESQVILGFHLAGSSKLPILLQPREKEAVIYIGSQTAITNGCELIALREISIGQRCQIGPQTLIYDADFHEIDPRRRGETGRTAAIKIEDNVWIGSRVTILKGVTIGSDSVIGAGCVVTKTIPAGSIVVGNPLKIVGSVYDRDH